MINVIEANWLAFALALIIGLLVAWWLFGRASTASAVRARVTGQRTPPTPGSAATADAARARAVSDSSEPPISVG